MAADHKHLGRTLPEAYARRPHLSLPPYDKAGEIPARKPDGGVRPMGTGSSKALTQYAVQTWQTQNGLPQNSILAVAQTRDGYLWLGTEEGLSASMEFVSLY